MNTVQVRVKWNKENFEGVEIDLTKDVAAFKQTLQKLTGVPPDRQKLMAKGGWVGTLKDDADLSKLKISPNLQVLLMGSADVVAAPSQQIVFMEDMSSQERAEKGVTVSAGLANLGNTCYLNSTVQCLRHMPELREALGPITQSATPATDISSDFLYTLRQLDTSEGSYTPLSFVHKFRTHYPAFAQRGNHGHFMQQDAEEFFNMLISSLTQGVQSVRGNLDSLMNIEIEERLKCSESETEPETVRKDKVYKLVCNISNLVAGASQIDHMADGIKLALEGTVEKYATTLDRNALWTKSQKLASLPKYLCVHFMRFFWKATPESRDHAGTKCKILRAVTFPETFDVYEFCNAEVQQKLRSNRDLASRKFEEELKAKQNAGSSTAAAMEVEPAASTVPAELPPSAAAAAAMEVDEDAAALQAALAMSVEAVAPPPAPADEGVVVVPGLPAGWTGIYELHGIVTHKGRDADSGHYIGWVRQSPGSRFWWKYDDDKVSEVNTEEIMLLKGGGDKDMAYLAFYRAKI